MSLPPLIKLGDLDEVASQLAEAGLSAEAATARAEAFRRCGAALAEVSPVNTSVVAYYVPGRIEVLGKHTDYAGGRSLLAACERGFSFVAVPRDDAHVSVHSVADDTTAEFDLTDAQDREQPRWAQYPMTAARRLARNFPSCRRGAHVAFLSDLPIAAGMSSSSALVVGTLLVLSSVNRLEESPPFRDHVGTRELLAGYLGCVENGQDFGSLTGDRGVGTFGGSEDHTTMLLAEPGAMVQYGFGPIARERSVPISRDYLFSVASSGVVAEKTGDARQAYNRLSLMVRDLLERWNATTGRDDPNLAAATRSSAASREMLQQAIGAVSRSRFRASELVRRYEHFLAESEEIIPAVPAEIDTQSVQRFGELTDRSQQLAEHLLGNQVPQTIHLARTARSLGAEAASSFGAGFGGSVWALVPRREADDFLGRWRDDYTRSFPAAAARAEFFLSGAGPAVVAVQK